MGIDVTHSLSACVLACVGAVAPPALSAPSADLAYLAYTDNFWQVWVADERGKRARQVTRTPSDKTRVSWFPDGRRLLASAQDGKVHAVDIASGEETAIVLEQGPVLDAVLSPDGQRLAYSFSTAMDGNDIWIANVDGSGPRKIAKQAALQHEPAWAPDGSALYYLSGDGGQAHDIWRLQLSDQATEQVTVGQLYHFDVAVGPDGSIAYSSNRDGNYEIYLQPRGATARRLTNDPALDARPAFSPDGKRIAFESTRSGEPQVWILDLSRGSAQQVTRQKGGARAPAWFHGGSGQ